MGLGYKCVGRGKAGLCTEEDRKDQATRERKKVGLDCPKNRAEIHGSRTDQGWAKGKGTK